MINPSLEDIGREVVYHDTRLKGNPIVLNVQDRGFITSFNDEFVFVRYQSGDTSAGTRREDLEWGNAN